MATTTVEQPLIDAIGVLAQTLRYIRDGIYEPETVADYRDEPYELTLEGWRDEEGGSAQARIDACTPIIRQAVKAAGGDMLLAIESLTVDEATAVETLDVDPYFASEAQEVFAVGHRIFLTENTPSCSKGAEGTYLGRTRNGAFVGLDTPSGEPYKLTVSFAAIKNLYR